jgi:hypothetical protein
MTDLRFPSKRANCSSGQHLFFLPQASGFTIAVLIAVLLTSCSTSPKEAKEVNEVPGSVKLMKFSQVITSPTKTLAMTANQEIKLAVSIKNSGSDNWYDSGAFPVNISYKWFKDGKLQPIEGERTRLPQPKIAPGGIVNADVRVVAPPGSGNYNLNVTLVQESVGWFSLSGADPLVIPATVK